MARRSAQQIAEAAMPDEQVEGEGESGERQQTDHVAGRRVAMGRPSWMSVLVARHYTRTDESTGERRLSRGPVFLCAETPRATDSR